MRINIILAILVVLGSYITCKTFHKKDDAVAPPVETVQEKSTKANHWKASHVIEGDNPDSASVYQVKQAPARVKVPWEEIAPPSTSRRAFLATNWWEIRMAYQPSDTSVHHHYQGKFLKFREDQTFDILQGNKVLESGHWAYDDGGKLLYIACGDTYFNNSWKLQENGFRMVWLGNTDINVTGIQIRMDGANKLPEGQ